MVPVVQSPATVPSGGAGIVQPSTIVGAATLNEGGEPDMQTRVRLLEGATE
jgi:hypothetical protein